MREFKIGLLDFQFIRFVIASSILGLISIFYFTLVEITPHFIGFGSIASLFKMIALYYQIKAITTGIAGPAEGLKSAVHITIFTITQTLRYMRVPIIFEIVGIVLCLIGAIFLSVKC